MNAQTNPQMTGNSLNDVIDRAKLIAKSIVANQKQQRSQPYADTLQGLSKRYAAATTPQAQIGLNQQANQARASYIASGGSPMDLDKSLWGSNPGNGFQTGTGQFKPGYAGDNLSIGQKIAQAPIFGNYEGRPTFDKQVSEAGLTGNYQGRPTLAKTVADNNLLYQQGQLTNDAFNNNTGRMNAQADAIYKQGTLTLGQDTLNKKPVTPDTTMLDALKLAVQDPDYNGATPTEKKNIIDNYYNRLSQQSATAQGGLTDQDILDMTGKK